jgi:uncharacterized membrane protein YagU involved in acid resistance
MLREPVNRMSHLRVAIAAGIAAAAIEMVFVLPIQNFLGASPLVVFQSIASGALGKAAFQEGLAAAALGLGIHLFVSLVAAGLYVLAAQRWPALLRRAAVCGMAYGVLVYLIMTFVVVPLSAIGFRPPRSLILMLTSLAVHVFAFGLPIALIVSGLLGAPLPSQNPPTPRRP